MQARNIIAITTVALVLATLGAAQDYEYEQQQPARSRPAASFQNSPTGPKPTPVAILKQINRHNEDGSYTYGYEGGDGSFKIETKQPNGEVKGKYGYVDNITGKVRVVEYGANRYGFQPAGEGITVAPPTLVDETTNKDGTINQDFDNGQYYDPNPAPARAAPRPKAQPQYEFDSAPRFAPAPRVNAAPVPARAQIPGAAPVQIDYSQPPRYQAPRPQPTPVHSFAPAPRPAPQRYEPAPVEEDIRYAEPAQRQVQSRPPPPPQYNRPVQSAPAFRPAPAAAQFAPRPQGQQGAPHRGGILDQLARDYALPQDSAAPLHDISFGYY